MKLWKVFKKGLKSNNGNIKWKIREWQKHDEELVMCSSGFHASKRIIDAMQYTNAEQIALVEVKGKHIKQDDKQCWSEMRLLRVYDWTKQDSISLAIYVAELVLTNFEDEYPNDKRPREAIEAAKKVLQNNNEKNKSTAASAAASAWSAAANATKSAWNAAESAASAAESAASTWGAAENAAWSAAVSAKSTAWSATKSAAWSAAYNKFFDKCEKFILKRIKIV